MVGTHSEFPSTDFAITSVNVPDRLDQREVDDRKLQTKRRFTRGDVAIGVPDLVAPAAAYLMLLAVLGLAGSWLAEQREAMAAGPSRSACRPPSCPYSCTTPDCRPRPLPSC